MVIGSTATRQPLLTAADISPILHERNYRPLFLIDLGVPRNFHPDLNQLDNVYLYNLDDLQATVSEGIRLRMQEVVHVQSIIAEEVSEFDRWLRSLSVVATISDLRQHVETLRQQELARTLRQLSASLSEREAAVVQELTTRLMNKLLHKPMLRLKDAAAVGQGHVYTEALRYLFDLEEKTDEAYYDRNEGQQIGDGSDAAGHGATATAMARAGDRHRADSYHG